MPLMEITLDTSVFVAIVVILCGVGVSVTGWMLLKLIEMGEQMAVMASTMTTMVKAIEELEAHQSHERRVRMR